jgi:hypothetical protein
MFQIVEFRMPFQTVDSTLKCCCSFGYYYGLLMIEKIGYCVATHSAHEPDYFCAHYHALKQRLKLLRNGIEARLNTCLSEMSAIVRYLNIFPFAPIQRVARFSA